MDELIQQITSRTGISEEQARQTVDMVLSFAKTKLPEPLASQLDGFMAGGSGSPDIMGQIGNMFGGGQ